MIGGNWVKIMLLTKGGMAELGIPYIRLRGPIFHVAINGKWVMDIRLTICSKQRFNVPLALILKTDNILLA